MTEDPEIGKTVREGFALADLLFNAVFMLTDDSHVALVGLLHAAIRTEVNTRALGKSSKWYRDTLHEVLDTVLEYEERRKVKGL